MQQVVTFIGIGSLALLVAGPALAYARILPPLAGFGLLALGCLLGLLATALVAALALSGNGIAWPGLCGMPAAIFIIYGVVIGMTVPRINDISTDLVDPPAFAAAASFPGNAGRSFAFPPANAPLIQAGYPTLQPMAVAMPADAAFDAVRKLAEQWGSLEQIHVDADTRTVEAYTETALFRFHDDVVIRVRPIEHGARIDMRSKSRDGQGDFGANTERIEAFFERLRAELKEVQL